MSNFATEHKIDATEKTIEDCIARIQKRQKSTIADFRDIYSKSSKAADLKDKNPYYEETGWQAYEKPKLAEMKAIQKYKEDRAKTNQNDINKQLQN